MQVGERLSAKYCIFIQIARTIKYPILICERAMKTEPVIPTGKIKTFGAFGPKYQVGRPLRQLEDGDWLVHILLVETGESTEYRLARILPCPG